MANLHQEKPSVSVIVPTWNGSSTLEDVLSMLSRQSVPFLEILVADSSSEDDSVEIARRFGAEITIIDQSAFDHGGTRTMMAGRARGDVLVFLTQDAIPASEDAVAKLIEPLLGEENVVASYGRQLPAKGASPFAEHLRLFNYPPESSVRELADREKIGLKTAFISNSFAAYLRKPLQESGFFKQGLIFGEDTCAVGRLLLQGGKIAYVAEAAVYHSHNYTMLQEFRRSFDIGVLHTTEQWLIATFGRAEGHGMDYVRSELTFLNRHGKLYLLPSYLLRNGLKLLGYRFGRNYKALPKSMVEMFSMNRKWWKNSARSENTG